MNDQLKRIFSDHADVLKDFAAAGTDTLAALAGACIEALRGGGKIFFFGNGGSAADAQHLAAELVNRFQIDRPALAALALTTDTSVLTSIANDSGFEEVFSRQVAALGKAGDVAVGLSTSGRSPNVLAALETARTMGLVTAVFTGGSGTDLAAAADYTLAVPSPVTARVQEMHILAGHALCAIVEDTLAAEGKGS
jgi:D-sedoheptulose 7-phosphate isomerase